ncbi:MAG: hypothetical protein ACYC7E_10830 [Armatimonadota bacterium]
MRTANIVLLVGIVLIIAAVIIVVVGVRLPAGRVTATGTPDRGISIIGKWELTKPGIWPFEDSGATIEFYPDGSFSGAKYVGSYSWADNTHVKIVAYGDKDRIYEVTLSNNMLVFRETASGDTIEFEKR